jgi:hypothetical protein
VARDGRKLHNEELHKLYASPNIISVIKSKRIIWTEHVARFRETRNAHTLLFGKPDGKTETQMGG